MTLGLFSCLNAMNYYAQIEPIYKYDYYADTKGKLLKVNKIKEQKYINTKTLIMEIDSKKEQIELSNIKKKLKTLSEVLNLKKENYNAVLSSSSKSKIEKNNYLIEILTLENQIHDLNGLKENYEDELKRKKINLENVYLDKIYTYENNYINNGTKLFSYYDVSKSKIVIFVKQEDIELLKNNPSVFINSKESFEYKIDRISKIKDTENITAYEVWLVKENSGLETFGEIVQIEFKSKDLK